MTPETYGIEEFTNETLGALKKAETRDELRDAIADMVKSIWLIGYNGGFEIAHEPAPCGHARGNWKDPAYGTPEYDGNEQCEACAAVHAERIEATRVERERCAGIARALTKDSYLGIGATGEAIADAIEREENG